MNVRESQIMETGKALMVENVEAFEAEKEEVIDFDELEKKLQSQLEDELADLEFLEEEKKKIGNPEALGGSIQEVVWEQIVNQIGVYAGEEFIKENRGMKLDLRNEAHIQTADNFAEGKIATHNTEIDYQKRYDEWQENFVKDENGNIVTHTTRTGKEEATLVKGARDPFDKDRPSGSKEKGTDMDHTVSAAEIIRDPGANAHMTKDEQIAFANSGENLNEMDSSQNRSKGDKSMTDWLDNPNSKGQKPKEIFDISDADEAKLRQKDAEARAEYERQKKEAEQRSIEAGKASQKNEAFRVGGAALKAVIMQLIAELVKEVIAKLVKWWKATKDAAYSLWDSLKEAVMSFVRKLKDHLVNTGNTFLTTIATAIWGPIIGLVKKVWIGLKQGWNSLKQAFDYIRNPENKNKPLGTLAMEVSKIIIAGFLAAGTMAFSEIIEKGLLAIPGLGAVFAYPIPLLNCTLASILGGALSAITVGIIGSIIFYYIDKLIAKKLKRDNLSAQIDKGNEILVTQAQQKAVLVAALGQTKISAVSDIQNRHRNLQETMNTSLTKVMEDVVAEDDKKENETQQHLDDMSARGDRLLNRLKNKKGPKTCN